MKLRDKLQQVHEIAENRRDSETSAKRESAQM